MKTYLIADSGGTQTDWCYVDQNGERAYFTTESFHPSQLNVEFELNFRRFWENHPNYTKANLYFYGAGCLNETNNKKMHDLFQNWGFENVKVLSDLEGACHAALKNNSGVVAILGTGSVVCQYDGVTIKKLNGGFGYLLGDEGSGYYFGKLFLQKLLNHEFSSELEDQLNSMFGDRASIIANVYSQNGKQFIGTIASKLSDLNMHIEINNLHEENLNLFFEKYINSLDQEDKKLSIIGRYGKYQQHNLTFVAQENGWEIESFIDAPIFLLSDYIICDAF